MSRFLRRSPSHRPGWTTFPSNKKVALTKLLSVVVAFSLAFIFAWENLYMDQLLSQLKQKQQSVENLRAQVTETRASIQKDMMVALSSTDASDMGLRAPDVAQVVLLSEEQGFFVDRRYASAQLSSLEHVQHRILEFFVTTALARADRPSQP
ncbi:MAG: hypothetical protein JSW03_09445 [Candidatus Eiseniibacteriota bacterium]|nr:MAG: hypothetical protein JSW03_09445 [Candidatus Eisenbacteria bacterium]